jgi:hypothetical protein
MDDQNTQSEPVAETPVQTPEPVPAPVEPESSQPNGSMPTDLPPEAPESPTSDIPTTPVESQNGGANEPESKPVEPSKEPQIEAVSASPAQSVSAPAPQTLVASQSQSLAQQDQTGFIRALLAKANAKLHSNRQKKLDNLMLMAQKKRIITNDDVQKLLRVSDATATRYLVKLVEQGRLARAGNPRDAKYQFVR